MKFSVSYEHRQFFQKQQHIEFDGLLTASQLVELKQAIESTLALRLAVEESSVHRQSADKLFMEGHDLWRANEAIKKIDMNSILAGIAAELVETKGLRLGYDQFLPDLSRRSYVTKGERPLENFLKSAHTLNEMSGLQGIACGLILCLSEPLKPELVATEHCFTQIPGNGVYISPDFAIDFQKLIPQQGTYLLIVYTEASAYYILNEGDPHAHVLKHLGYHFGDKLKDKLNPVVFRSSGG